MGEEDGHFLRIFEFYVRCNKYQNKRLLDLNATLLCVNCSSYLDSNYLSAIHHAALKGFYLNFFTKLEMTV